MPDTAAVNIPITTSADTRSLDELTKELRESEKALRSMSAADPGWEKQAAGVSVLRGRISELNAITRRNDEASQQAARGNVNFGNAVLQGSRAMQDAQYGLAGVVNNLEGIAAAFGLGSGVAGAVTVAAVIIQQYGPRIIAWFKELDTEGKAVDALQKRLRSTAQTILGDWTPASDEAATANKKFTDSINAEKEAFEALNSAQKTGLDLYKQKQDAEAAAAKNKAEKDIGEIKGKKMQPDDEARAIAAVKINQLNEDKRRQEDALNAEQQNASNEAATKSTAAEQAAARRKKLDDERRLALGYAGIATAIGGQYDDKGELAKDADGNVIDEGQASRVKKAQDAVELAKANKANADRRGDPTDKADKELADAVARLKQQQQRLDDLLKEEHDTKKENGGSNFRSVKDIERDLAAAAQQEKSAKDASQKAIAEKAALDARQNIQRQRINDEYKTQADKITGELPDESPKRVEHDHSRSDPFEQTKYTSPPRRNLYEEELTGKRPERQGRNLYAEEAMLMPKTAPDGPVGSGGRQMPPANSDLAHAAKQAAASNDAANQATLRNAEETAAALQKMQRDNEALKRRMEEMSSQMKGMRS